MKQLYSFTRYSVLILMLALCTMLAQSASYKYVYFDNTASWEQVSAYVWSPESLGSWPGTVQSTMTSDGKYYKVAIPISSGASKIIFNNNDNGKKTDDLSLIENEIYNASGDTGEQYTPDPDTEKPTITMTQSKAFFTETFSVSIAVENATSASYTLNGGTPVSFTESTTLTVTGTSTVTVTASNANGTVSETAAYTFRRKPSTDATELASYYKTNPNGLGKRKTVFSYDDFTTDDIIAQGVANDDPRVYCDNSMHEVGIDLYALYATYDDSNLYLGWDMTNLQDVVAPTSDYPLSQGVIYKYLNAPIMILFDTEDGGGNGMTSATGSTLWDSNITYTANVNRVVMCSYNASNGPFVYKNNGTLIDPLEIYNAQTCGINFKVANFGMGIHPSTVYGPNGAYGTTGNPARLVYDITKDYQNDAEWVEFNSLGHDSDKYDFHFYMSIPLTTLGITASQIETRGLGMMLVATYGISGMDCLPYDLQMNNNADQPDTSSQAINSYEKSDADHITAPFAYIGNYPSGVETVETDAYDGFTNVYTLSGAVIRSNVAVSSASDGLPAGLYIVKNPQGKYAKVCVK